MRAALVWLCHLLLRIFFRRIEVVGQHHIPAEGGVIFALNHPSGLIDPLFILCLSGRRVSFLAKAPLFHMPVVGFFVRAFESLPVYRKQDGNDPTQNRKIMQAAAELLKKGNAIAIFPEATSHSEPTLKRFRSGAVRIALSARSLSLQEVSIVPGALYYEHKQAFRSRAVLAYGAPLQMPKITLDSENEPDRELVSRITDELQASVTSLLPTAATAEALILAERAERLLLAAVRDTPEQCPTAAKVAQLPSKPTLADRMRTRRRILDRYNQLVAESPQQVQSILEALRDVSSRLEAAGLPIDASAHSWSHRGPGVFARMGALAMLAPFAAAGILVHLPAYHAVRYVAFRYSGDSTDVMASVKLVAGLAFFPLTWVVIATLGVALSHNFMWILAGAICPLVAWLTMSFLDLTSLLMVTARRGEKARHAELSWTAILKNRAAIAEDMARLLSTERDAR